MLWDLMANKGEKFILKNIEEKGESLSEIYEVSFYFILFCFILFYFIWIYFVA